MALFVYALCAGTALVCFALLLRQHWRERSSMTLTSSIGLLCLAAANVLLFIDLVVLPQIDLLPWRNIVTLAGVVVLLVAVTQNHEGNGRW